MCLYMRRSGLIFLSVGFPGVEEHSTPQDAVQSQNLPGSPHWRVITVSLETMKIVRALPRLDIVVGGKS